MPPVAVASSSGLAADAGARVAVAGGNAVDGALAAALVSAVTEPGVSSLGGGAFLTIWPAGGEPLVIDGHVEMPGRGLPADRLGGGAVDVWMEYGGGVATTVGPGSVGTPGLLGAVELASERYGSATWAEILAPSYEYARDGFPLPQPSYDYLIHSGDSVFGWDPPSRAALHDARDRLLRIGDPVHVAGLAESIQEIAEEGASAFYEGELGRRIVDGLAAGGGVLTREDLSAYRPVVREPLKAQVDTWSVATAPSPSLGGATLTAFLSLLEGRPAVDWSVPELRHLIRAQEVVLRHLARLAERGIEVEAEVGALIDASQRELRSALESPSTVHTSAVDANGLACSVTISAGYGSGAMPGGTGIWMNNCLGEIELSPEGYHALPPGTRLRSAMAPTLARRDDGAILAIGSPGASRIPSAILFVLLSHLRLGMSLQEAVEHPRLHVELESSGVRVDFEEGLPVDRLEVNQRRHSRSMYFGGVAAVRMDPPDSFSVAADPRRSGSAAVSDGDR